MDLDHESFCVSSDLFIYFFFYSVSKNLICTRVYQAYVFKRRKQNWAMSTFYSTKKDLDLVKFYYSISYDLIGAQSFFFVFFYSLHKYVSVCAKGFYCAKND